MKSRSALMTRPPRADIASAVRALPLRHRCRSTTGLTRPEAIKAYPGEAGRPESSDVPQPEVGSNTRASPLIRGAFADRRPEVRRARGGVLCWLILSGGDG